MIVCHCRRISDRAIRKAVREGAGTLTEVAQVSGAATACGGCAPAVQDVLFEELDREPGQTLVGASLLGATS